MNKNVVTTKEKLYAIKIDRAGRFDSSKKNRYILCCDDNWYETTNNPTPLFTYNQARDIAKMLPNHYVYIVTLIDSNGVMETVSHFRKNRLFNHDIPVKKSIFALNNGVFAKKKNNYFK